MDFYRIDPSQALADKALLKEPVAGDLSYTAYESADEAFRNVVTKAGASLPRYDENDIRILAEAAGLRDPQFQGQEIPYKDKNGVNRIAKPALGVINSPYDITLQSHDDFVALDEATKTKIHVTCYPSLKMADGEQTVVDTDGDGLPDAYETEKGLNPNDASDGMALTKSGYSNLEIFLNAVADGKITN